MGKRDIAVRPIHRIGSIFGDDFFDTFFESPWESSLTRRKSLTRGGYPVNIRDEDETRIIEMAIPGFSKSDINIDVSENQLTISTDSVKDAEENDGNYLVREFSRSRMTQSFSIPETDPSSIEASYESGILTLRVPILTKRETITRVKVT